MQLNLRPVRRIELCTKVCTVTIDLYHINEISSPAQKCSLLTIEFFAISNPAIFEISTTELQLFACVNDLYL